MSLRAKAVSGLGVLCVCLTAILIAVFVFVNDTAASTVEQIAECNTIQGYESRTDCFRDVIRMSLKTKDGTELMNQLSELPGRSCHKPGHVLGEELMNRYGSIEVALSHCSQKCAGACLHGMVVQALALPTNESPISDKDHPDEVMLLSRGKEFCSTAVQACHGVGHALYVLEGELEGALARCGEFTNEYEFLVACQRGVFMQHVFAPGIDLPVDARKLPVKASDALSLCENVSDPFKIACFRFPYLQQDELFAEQGVSDYVHVQNERVDACGTFKERAFYLACIEGVAYAPGVTLDCSRFTNEDERSMCVLGAAAVKTTYDQYEDVVAYCAEQNSEMLKEACYNSYFRGLYFRKVQPLSDACEKSSDVACAAHLKRFIADPTKNVFRELTTGQR